LLGSFEQYYVLINPRDHKCVEQYKYRNQKYGGHLDFIIAIRIICTILCINEPQGPQIQNKTNKGTKNMENFKYSVIPA